MFNFKKHISLERMWELVEQTCNLDGRANLYQMSPVWNSYNNDYLSIEWIDWGRWIEKYVEGHEWIVYISTGVYNEDTDCLEIDYYIWIPEQWGMLFYHWIE